jgi:hypothetical protein
VSLHWQCRRRGPGSAARPAAEPPPGRGRGPLTGRAAGTDARACQCLRPGRALPPLLGPADALPMAAVVCAYVATDGVISTVAAIVAPPGPAPAAAAAPPCGSVFRDSESSFCISHNNLSSSPSHRPALLRLLCSGACGNARARERARDRASGGDTERQPGGPSDSELSRKCRRLVLSILAREYWLFPQ